jgi:hypothetical protein
MTARIVKIGNRSWLAGMSWCSFEDIPNRAEMVEDAQRLKASWSALRKGDSAIQGGFCAPVEGMKAPGKVFSLAAMLADSGKQPWLGTFKIAEGLWWYVAVRDEHAILPDGDVIGGEAEIFTARERHSGYGDWNYIEGDLTLLEELIADVDAKPTRVRSLTGSNIQLGPVIAGTFAAAVALSGGGYWWMEQKAAQERERATAMARVRAEIAGEAQKTAATSKASSMPAPNAWLKACHQVISPLPLSLKGWALDQLSCQGDAVVLRWLIQDGATLAGRPAGVVSAQGDAVEQSIPLEGLARQSEDNAIGLNDGKLALRTWAQAHGYELKFDEAVAPPALPGAALAPAAAPKEVRLAMAMSVSPFGVDMSSLPGLRLTKIEPTVSGWRLEGMVYGR